MDATVVIAKSTNNYELTYVQVCDSFIKSKSDMCIAKLLVEYICSWGACEVGTWKSLDDESLICLRHLRASHWNFYSQFRLRGIGAFRGTMVADNLILITVSINFSKNKKKSLLYFDL